MGTGRTSGRRTIVGSLLACAIVSWCISCGGETSDDAADPSTTATSPATTTSGATTTSPATTTATTTSPATTSSPTTTVAPSTTTATSVATYPTTTVHQVPDDCDVDAMLAAADDMIGRARLAPGGPWDVDGTSAFDEETNDAEEFRDRLGLDCRLRAVQATDDVDRLLVAAWTGPRRAFVIQATDGPTTAYRRDQRLQLLVEQPYGEWLVEQEAWAGTLADGGTVIVVVDDDSLGATAKAWQALPRWEDLPVTNDAERHAIDVLLHAGARNVSPAEPAGHGSTIAAVQFVTTLGNPLVATVAPIGDFDHTAPIVEGTHTVVTRDGVDFHVTDPVPDSYAVGAVGWQCGEHVWFVDAVWGTLDELLDWAATVARADGCGTG